jgi:hypothetical protein
MKRVWIVCFLSACAVLTAACSSSSESQSK